MAPLAPSMLLLLKLAGPPVLVAAISLAARLWGPTVGALLMGLPWLTGPVLFFLALDKGEAFGVAACTGIELGVVCICAFVLAYGVASAVAPWPVCLAAAAGAFAACAWATQDIAIDLLTAAAVAAASLVLTYLLLPRPAGGALPARLPWWNIPARMLATFVLVGSISLLADALGPQLSGIVATYPAIVTVIGTFTHSQWGADAVRRMLRGLAISLLAFVAFFLVVGLTLPTIGLAMAYVLAAAAALPVSALLLALGRFGGSH
jgi:hypothetical protein